MTADQLKHGLAAAAREREEADKAKARATAKAIDLLRQVARTEGVSMTDAALILGVSRVGAYKMLDG